MSLSLANEFVSSTDSLESKMLSLKSGKSGLKESSEALSSKSGRSKFMLSSVVSVASAVSMDFSSVVSSAVESVWSDPNVSIISSVSSSKSGKSRFRSSVAGESSVCVSSTESLASKSKSSLNEVFSSEEISSSTGLFSGSST